MSKGEGCEGCKVVERRVGLGDGGGWRERERCGCESGCACIVIGVVTNNNAFKRPHRWVPLIGAQGLPPGRFDPGPLAWWHFNKMNILLHGQTCNWSTSSTQSTVCVEEDRAPISHPMDFSHGSTPVIDPAEPLSAPPISPKHGTVLTPTWLSCELGPPISPGLAAPSFSSYHRPFTVDCSPLLVPVSPSSSVDLHRYLH
ncbi:hypothetical protein BD413DRAFT_192631 [Trametes elegans]|nr:hypothetical protein BD413DRAFT_192631 [Trametes elegans]